jgi:hypothetical protein
MTTPEDKSILWLKHVIDWLNKDKDNGESSLSEPARLLLERLEKECDRKELKKAWDVIDDLVRLSNVSDSPEFAEIYLRCGMEAAEMGNFKEAQKFFSEAATKCSANSRHNYAVAQWMKGCMEWLLPGKEVDAINSWRESEKKFEALKKGKENKKDENSWYEAKCTIMNSALRQATKEYEIPRPPSNAGQNEVTTVGADIKNGNASGDPRSDRMGIFSVYKHINAGSFGSSGILDEPHGTSEVEQVFIDDKSFRILAINGNRFFRTSTQSNIIVKVSGDSMNKAGVQSGDYVLLRMLPKGFKDFTGDDDQTDINSFQLFKDGDIVAAEIFDQDDDVATLKRISRWRNKIILRPESTNPKHVEREFDATDEGFTICGVVVAILKPIND